MMNNANVSQVQQYYSWTTETALEWWERSQQQKSQRCYCRRNNNNDRDADGQPPNDASVAAYKFCCPTSTDHESGTGISYIDAALTDPPLTTTTTTTTISEQQDTGDHNIRHWDGTQRKTNLPVIDISGDSGTGKTWTLLTLAARFVVRTRSSSLYPPHHIRSGRTVAAEDDTTPPSPQVILFDSKYEVSVSKLAQIVQSMLLKIPISDDDVDEKEDAIAILENDMVDCLRRIHITTTDDMSGWVPILETLRHSLLSPPPTTHPHHQPQPPPHPVMMTLILWDDFLSEPILTAAATTTTTSSAAAVSSTSFSSLDPILQQQQQLPKIMTGATTVTAIRMDVVRQLERLLLECPVFLVTTTSTANYSGTTTTKRRRRRTIGRECWDRLVTHRIHLEHHHHVSGRTIATVPAVEKNDHDDNDDATTNVMELVHHHDYIATVGTGTHHPTSIPFSISNSGILS
jgi:hypothetical protein